MKELGEQWIEVIDGKRHMVKGYLNEKPVEKKHAGSKEGYSVDISKYDTI